MMTTPIPFTIRPALADERDAARALTLEAYAQYAETMAPNDWAGLHQALLGALATTGAATHLVAVRADGLVGSVLLFPAANGDTAGAGGRMIWPELRLLAVAPAARGQGVGAALVQACIAQARAAGAAILGLYTGDSMRTAMALYERLGFTRIPQYDFLPPGTEQLVKAYRLVL
ncbi:MAG: GNAT family N-acetyltransferase [Chloroflexales bacterium]|nr:GNAT family N-acetyltransferase [Chloroflexales bacterium]